ncbi:MAG: GTPase Der [Chlamydiia bacterium]|nr:GTPase Der [Chlamydiia bacterium]
MLRVAIVGRPNVGKSALFNRICGRRQAIVEDYEGVTRDRNYGQTEVYGRSVEFIDTGGIDVDETILFHEEINRQVEIAVGEADLILFVADGVCGVTKEDEMVVRRLRKVGKPVYLAVNKIDTDEREGLVFDFLRLGVPDVFGVSAVHGMGIADLLEKMVEDAPFLIEDENPGIRVAIVGRANVGKSTLLNHILQEDRSVVSDIPGTTRDSIDVKIEVGDELFTLIDTAGIRRKSSEKESVDKFAAIRTERAIERADICLLIIDSLDGFTTQEKSIADMIVEKGKGCVIFFNKWDLVHETRMEHYIKAARAELSFLNHCEMVIGSAKQGRNVPKLFDAFKQVYTSYHERIGTGELNRLIEDAMQRRHPPMLVGKRLKVFFSSQVSTAPPQFVLFVNNPQLMVESYRRYLMNQFRKLYPFKGVPIQFKLKKRTVKRRPEFLPSK